MEFLPMGNYLKFQPNQLQGVRKLYNLDKPGCMEDAVDILSEWVQKQYHFRKKDFPREYLEILLVTNKGSVERSKTRLDKLCTLKSAWPEFFTSTDIKSCAKQNKVFQSLILPEAMDDFTRVALFRMFGDQPITSDIVTNYINYSNIVGEYLKIHDYISGFRLIVDFMNVNIMDFLTVVTPTQLSQVLQLYLDGYGMRLKGIHIMSSSRMVDAVVSLLKQLLSKKMGGRLYVHKTVESVYEFIPRRILPADYGGDSATCDEILDDFLTELGSDEHIKYMMENNAASTDESKRISYNCNGYIDNFVGVTGSFRTLSVD